MVKSAGSSKTEIVVAVLFVIIVIFVIELFVLFSLSFYGAITKAQFFAPLLITAMLILASYFVSKAYAIRKK